MKNKKHISTALTIAALFIIITVLTSCTLGEENNKPVPEIGSNNAETQASTDTPPSTQSNPQTANADSSLTTPHTPTPSPELSVETDTIYGAYTLMNTVDINGNVKNVEALITSLTLNEDDTYEVVFGDGSEPYTGFTDNLGTGRIEAVKDDDYRRTAPEWQFKEWQFYLHDYRGSDGPSYHFVVEPQIDGTLCVLGLPGGAEMNAEWIENADYWMMGKN